MPVPFPAEALQLRSLITRAGELEVTLDMVAVRPPAPGEVVVRIEASPINPSDLGTLFGPADMRTARRVAGSAPKLTAKIADMTSRATVARLDQPLPVGLEGAGMVVAAGESPAAQALLGRPVAMFGGAMYAQYRTIPIADCLPLPEGTTPAEGASCFVNPLTALGMVETMRMEGHTALVHTAAASNLGIMLNRICLAAGIGLVNIVRSPAQAAMLQALGAPHVVDSSAPDFLERLAQAVAATGATLAFDALGGGRIGGQILSAMEAALAKQATSYDRYGSAVHKQLYIYGGLDTGPTVFERSFGMSYGIGGWLLFPFLAKAGPAVAERLKARVAAELKTTFASHYAMEISLADVLDPEKIALFGKRATGKKFLINPSRGEGDVPILPVRA